MREQVNRNIVDEDTLPATRTALVRKLRVGWHSLKDAQLTRSRAERFTPTKTWCASVRTLTVPCGQRIADPLKHCIHERAGLCELNVFIDQSLAIICRTFSCALKHKFACA